MRKSRAEPDGEEHRHDRDVRCREAGRGTALAGERRRSAAAGERQRGRRGNAAARRGHAAGAAHPAQRARGAADRAGARHRQLRARQPLAGRGRRGWGCAAARAPRGPPLMDAPESPAENAGADQPLRSALGGLLGAGLDAVRTRLDLAAVELEIHLLALLRVLVCLIGALACALLALAFVLTTLLEQRDRKSTRLNSSHTVISYAVFCLKKKKTHCSPTPRPRLRNRPRRASSLSSSL